MWQPPPKGCSYEHFLWDYSLTPFFEFISLLLVGGKSIFTRVQSLWPDSIILRCGVLSFIASMLVWCLGNESCLPFPWSQKRETFKGRVGSVPARAELNSFAEPGPHFCLLQDLVESLQSLESLWSVKIPCNVFILLCFSPSWHKN